MPLAPKDSLRTGFRTPPRSSHPETWFHLIGGNVSKPGLTADLEAIQKAGLEGIQLFHGNATGQAWKSAPPQIECLSPSWDNMIRHTASECQRLGLRFTMQNCPGWAMSGGPWITPGNAMRHLIWSQTRVEQGQSGSALSLALARPQPSQEPWRDFRDIAVLAFPTPDGDAEPILVPTAVRSSQNEQDWAAVLAGNKGATVRVAAASAAEKPSWVEVTFAQPVTLRSLELPPVEKLALRRNFDPGATIHVQALGESGLVEVARREIPRSNWQDDQPLVLAVPKTVARGFRFTFENKTPLEFSVFTLSSAARLHDWHGQSGLVLRSLDRSVLLPQDRAAWIAPESVLDLSRYLDESGTLHWSPPAGKWTILRFGHVNTGKKNGPAPPEATGFECDKLSPRGAEAHFAGYIGRLSAPGGAADAGRLKGMVIDSWECRTQTWTPALEKEFAALRGYALRSWLPALAGWVVGDPGTSERFLRDWRATLSDLLVRNYYSRLAALGRARGMTLSFESGPGDVPTGDILQYYGQADIPMCEFWHPNDPHGGGLEAKPMLPAVSAAHIYGKPRIAAEAFTNIGLRWDEHPFMLKHLADRHFAQGLNHLVFHTYTHNPSLELVPGTSFGRGIGTPFLRGQTWWKHLPHFTEYLARTSFLLEQGQPVSDVLWYLGDDLDHKPRQDQGELFPEGFKYDYLNADALLNRLSVDKGLLKTPEGVTWRVLLLPNRPRLTAATLARLSELVRKGATVIGLPSSQNPTLSGGDQEQRRFQKLLEELWGTAPSLRGERRLGAGRLLWGGEVRATLAQLGIEPDVSGARSALWCHRRTETHDIYFVAADRKAPLRAALSFRSQGQPELWDPLTGTSKPASIVEPLERPGKHTRVFLELPAAGSVFVIFPRTVPTKKMSTLTRITHNGVSLTEGTDRGVPQATQGLKSGEEVQPWVETPPPIFEYELLGEGKQLLCWENGDYTLTRSDKALAHAVAKQAKTIPLIGPWYLSFPPGWDAPERLALPTLQPWSELADQATRAFSGSATYTTEVNLDVSAASARLMLDLGRVAVIAEVTVNGKAVATLWAAPFRVEITGLVRPGRNSISVTVTNTWHNRLAYDAALPESQRKTWAINAPKKNAPLQLAGLLGPVVIRQGELIKL
ncbi:glycosyl hydrolase [Armatimonas sp.]|uniref:glycosyl hydrolase n=1 Tax=Armatimonas sp. TaxID=1872638 RepID=UPI00286A7BFD|nr:glycosyl hydrolase [Armatimonas sp.]